MQTTSAAFTAEQKALDRGVTVSTSISWKKQYSPSYKPFTIGVSAIGGADTIASVGTTVSDWTRYLFFDESDYVTALSYERGLKMPIGGLSMAVYDVELDNTTGRYTPRYMGGSGELYTSVNKVMRPTVINAGFNVNGVDQNIPQIVGVNDRPMRINTRSKSAQMTGYDFISYLRNSYLDRQIMFTSQRSDQVIANVLSDLGFATAQYDLDYGINPIPFGLFDVGTRFSDVVDKLVEAENGRFYQDETGVLKFENRQHWDSAPYNSVSRVIYTAQVIDAESPNDDHIINVVEVKSKYKVKQPLQVIMNFNTATIIAANSTIELFFQYDNPILAVTTPTNGGSDSYYLANNNSDGSGTDRTSDVSVKSISNFAQTSKIIFQNNSSSPLFLTSVVISGRPVKNVADIYVRAQDDSSVTAYQERQYVIENEYIQNQDWAASYAQMVINDFAEPENLQKIKIRAMPDLQLGDLVSWQGRYWRVFDIKTTITPSDGFVQELTMLQRQINSYFRIGISTIGGEDKIAP